ncbi:hypothetical protein [Phenylobacterium sp. J367]|uniref:hypothetical protein n=1 Tax=Phenylobacterium sp. J367 TaxID=2898435 RepID=UPI002150B5D3|nr:hypothetical protein [Phenylobacterium sp. J367]MCR5877705.1 hypothetical protein [Phenylobacterium sp. J367]
MKRLRRLAILAFGLAATGAAAVPPPPAVLPEGVPATLDGYDLRVLYARWGWWIEGEKGPVTHARAQGPAEAAGLTSMGPPMASYQRSSDYGRFTAGEVRAYCQPLAGQSWRPTPGTCQYLVRWAWVPDEVLDSPERSPVARWMREAFDAPRLVAHLKAIGLGPGTDWWRADVEQVFAGLPSPRPMLRENSRVETVDSRGCPALRQAVDALEGHQPNWRLDLYGPGPNREAGAPAPHSVTTAYSFTTLIGQTSGFTTVSGGAAEQLAAPILDAAWACHLARNPEAARRPAYGPGVLRRP